MQGAAGRWGPAVKYLTESLNLRPDATRVWLDLGYAEWERNRLDAAQAAFRKALALSARSADAHLAMGRLADERGDRRAAGDHLARAVKLDGDNAEYKQAGADVYLTKPVKSQLFVSTLEELLVADAKIGK